MGPALCEFPAPTFLLFSENVAPLVYYSHLPIILIACALALYILFQNLRNLANHILFWTLSSFAFWVFLDSVFWAANRSDVVMFVWSLQILIEPIPYIGCLYLLYVLTKKQDAPFVYKGIVAFAYAPIIALVPTAYFLSSFDTTICLAKETYFSYYSYLFELFIVVWIVGLTSFFYRKATPGEERQNLLVLTAGIVMFLLAFAWGNITGSFTEDWALGQYGLFGMPLFIGLLVYSIVRYKTFDIQIIGSIALVAGLTVLTFSLLFVQSVIVFRGVALATFLFSVVLGYFLVRAIRSDIAAKQRIELLARELEAANRRQESLIHFVSHEVKGALGKCVNVLSLITDGDYGIVPEKVGVVAKKGLSDTRDAVAMVTTILLSANVKSGAIRFKREPFDIKESVRTVLRELGPDAQAKGLSLAFEFEGTHDFSFCGDAEMITRHVIRNLVDNAVRYTLQGTITIRLVNQNGIRLSVTDSGVGIRKEDMARLFTEGGRGRDSTKINVSSTGYGLFFAKQIVEAHNGRIWAESAGEGKGSTFFVTF